MISLSYNEIIENLNQNSYTWLVTGAAGFIGSNLCEFLLNNNQMVMGVDNFSSGYEKNINRLVEISKKTGSSFFFEKLDVRDLKKLVLFTNSQKPNYILHHAALGSVPASIKDPILCNEINVIGFLNILGLAKDINAKLVYASSSAVYGDLKKLPLVEKEREQPLSPYALTKIENEMYADLYYKIYGLSSVGLRYFNVYGPHQDPKGIYAAVISKWFESCINGEKTIIFGDGHTTRDFCFITDIIQANILSAFYISKTRGAKIFNVGTQVGSSLNDLNKYIQGSLNQKLEGYKLSKVEYKSFRDGDIKHSVADISYAKRELNYTPQVSLTQGLNKLADWLLMEKNKR